MATFYHISHLLGPSEGMISLLVHHELIDYLGNRLSLGEVVVAFGESDETLGFEIF